jgi:hypothetical protein
MGLEEEIARHTRGEEEVVGCWSRAIAPTFFYLLRTVAVPYRTVS